MQKKLILILGLFLYATTLLAEEIVTRKDGTKVVLHDDHTWAELNTSKLSQQDIVNKNQSFLRSGIRATDREIVLACEMYEQGWTYTMPRPKSSKAAWGITDARTTWYHGWWYNSKTEQYSETTPVRAAGGRFLGDHQKRAHSWRKGGTPRRPDVFMFLLSGSGGPGY